MKRNMILSALAGGLAVGLLGWAQTESVKSRATELDALRRRLSVLEKQSDNTERSVSQTRYLALAARKNAAATAEELRARRNGMEREDLSTDEVRELDDSGVVTADQGERSILDDDYDFEGQERFFTDYFEELEQARLGTGRDPEWEDSAREAVESALASEDLNGTALQLFECSARLCRLEVAHEDEAARSQFSVLFLASVRDHFGKATIHGPIGSKKAVTYLARAGHELPTPSRPPGTRE